MYIPQFETNVPIPAAKIKGRKRGPVRFALDLLEVGQSAFIPLSAWQAETSSKRRHAKPLNNMQTSLCTHLRKHPALKGRKFVTRQISDGIRVWRVEPKASGQWAIRSHTSA